MGEAFDPYHKWLGIPPEERPPTYYSLLGLQAFEADADVISNAVDGRMAQVKSFQAGKHSADSQRILNEIATAKVNLLDLRKKAAYDQRLRERLGAGASVGGTANGVLAALPFLEDSTVASRPAKTAKKSGGAKSRFPWYVPVAAACAVVLLGIIFTAVALQSTGPAVAERSKDATEGKPAVTPADRGVAPTAKKEFRPIEPKPDPVVPAKVAEKPDPGDPEVKVSKAVVPPAKPKPDPELPAKEKPEPGKKPQPDEEPKPKVAEPAQKKPVVPREDEQKAAEARVRDIFQKEFAAAKTSEAKLTLANTLFNQGTSLTDNPGERFVLWRMAAEQAAAAGAISDCLGFVDKLAESYPVSVLVTKGEMLAKSSETVRPGSAGASLASQIVEAALGLGQQAVADDDFDTASRFLKLAGATARRTKDTQLNHEVSTRRTEWDRLRLRYSGVQKALDRLAEDPSDAEANLIGGRWFCFDKGDWDKGLPMLAKGSNPLLAEVAGRELTKPTEARSQVEQADAWWAASEKETLAKAAIQARAVQWYEEALPKLTGLDKTRVEKRLEAFHSGTASKAAENTGSKVRGAVQPGNVALAANGATVKGLERGENVIDGNPNYTRTSGTAVGTVGQPFTVILPKTYQLREIRVLFWELEPRSTNYIVATSVDGKEFTPLVDRSQGVWSGWQRIAIPSSRPVKAIQVTVLKRMFPGPQPKLFPTIEVVAVEAYCVPPR